MYLEPIDPECRKFLRALKRAQLKSGLETIEIDTVTEMTKYKRNVVCRIAEFLEDMRIIGIDKYDTGGYAGFHLTQRGRMYNRYRWYEFRSTVLFSIVLPLIISAVSGALTALLTLLPQLT